MARPLTAQSVDKLKPNPAKRLEVPDGLLPGLYLIIQPSGARSWAVRYRRNGQTRKLTLGPYPALTLAIARERARAALKAAQAGEDPAADKRQAPGATAVADDGASDLISDQLDAFLARHVRLKGRPRYAGEVERLLEREVRPLWGNRRVQDITRADVVALLDALMDRGSPTTANRTFAAVRKFFNWLIERSVLDASPCMRVRAPHAETSRDRVLSEDELRWLWMASERLGWPFGPFTRFLLLTGQRRDEVAKARRNELRQPDLWTIPRERTKNGIAHDVPLSTAAQTVMASLLPVAGRPGYLFTTTGEHAVSGYSKAKARLDRLMLECARAEAQARGGDPDAIILPEWRLHDLRRTLASGLARLGHPPHVVEAVLNHTNGTISGVAAIYNRYSYLVEKRHALEAWGRFIEALAGPPRQLPHLGATSAAASEASVSSGEPLRHG
ncbi:integrase arm-type DNA-binding domain-containing protein [Microvirga aerilata]|uniref:Integrase arm-type DNA-binding domain-containing protein n=1 Tax=Microvirga aerilata TaxID=670292 RepID=A0A936ZC80_9HYPH|nr:site-specific integrase [Microvirga aerilata]MBL0404412.1 integrase arm-type DNA-binding domain-containing protein [Microvirga aerilata]